MKIGDTKLKLPLMARPEKTPEVCENYYFLALNIIIMPSISEVETGGKPHIIGAEVADNSGDHQVEHREAAQDHSISEGKGTTDISSC